jgi:hypothetical protein
MKPASTSFSLTRRIALLLGTLGLSLGTGFAQAKTPTYTDVLKIAIEEFNPIDTWAGKKKTAAELATVLGLDKSVTELYLSRASYGTAVVTREILAEQQVIADTFFELKLIPKKLNLLHAAPVNLS